MATIFEIIAALQPIAAVNRALQPRAFLRRSRRLASDRILVLHE
jgi:hypothetical protein